MEAFPSPHSVLTKPMNANQGTLRVYVYKAKYPQSPQSPTQNPVERICEERKVKQPADVLENKLVLPAEMLACVLFLFQKIYL